MTVVFKSYAKKLRYIADQFYEQVPISFCIYCGECWDVYDHVPPVSAWCKNSSWAFKYPACKDCNAILNSNPIKDIRVRRYFIIKRLFSRYKKLIKMPNWDKYEIREIEGMLRAYVKRSKLKKDYILNRLDFLMENYLEPKV